MHTPISGSSYRLLSGNCQHFVEYILSNISSDMYKPEAHGTVMFDELTNHFWKKMLVTIVAHIDKLSSSQRSEVSVLEVMFGGKDNPGIRRHT